MKVFFSFADFLGENLKDKGFFLFVDFYCKKFEKSCKIEGVRDIFEKILGEIFT